MRGKYSGKKTGKIVEEKSGKMQNNSEKKCETIFRNAKNAEQCKKYRTSRENFEISRTN